MARFPSSFLRDLSRSLRRIRLVDKRVVSGKNQEYREPYPGCQGKFIQYNTCRMAKVTLDKNEEDPRLGQGGLDNNEEDLCLGQGGLVFFYFGINV